MKKNPTLVNGYKAPTYLCKVHLKSWRERIVWWLFRRYLLNEDYFRVLRRFTGPRPRGTNQASTLKKNAIAYRFYLEPRERNHAVRAQVHVLPVGLN